MQKIIHFLERCLKVLNPLLLPRRLVYAKILGAVLWGAWLLSMVLGTGYLDLAGQEIGTDFLQYYAAGRIVQQGDSARLYDLAYVREVETQIIGQEPSGIYNFILPPFMAWFFLPFALLPYRLSFALWVLLCLAVLWGSLRALMRGSPKQTFLWSLTWFPVFAAVSFGQNSLVSLFLFALTYYLWVKERPLSAGLAASLLAYKPQLLLGLGLLWLFRWRKDWRALLGLALGGVALVLLCFGTLPEASRAYVDFALKVMPEIPNWSGRQVWHTQTFYEFWLLLLPKLPAVANLLRLVLVGIGAVAIVRFWHRFREEKALLYAGMIGFLFWITPHANIYEMSLLLIPAVLLREHRPDLRFEWRRLFALLWLAMLLSGPLTYAQVEVLHLPFAVQLSVPLWAMALGLAYHWLMAPGKEESKATSEPAPAL